eukprot:COSAG02_NODE_20681_length_819_cov_2.263889_1_plen_119_part_01
MWRRSESCSGAELSPVTDGDQVHACCCDAAKANYSPALPLASINNSVLQVLSWEHIHASARNRARSFGLAWPGAWHTTNELGRSPSATKSPRSETEVDQVNECYKLNENDCMSLLHCAP